MLSFKSMRITILRQKVSKRSKNRNKEALKKSGRIKIVMQRKFRSLKRMKSQFLKSLRQK